MKRFVYFFGAGKAEGSAEMKDLLGGKGANLAEMTNLGIHVPAGFTITTEVCTTYYKEGGDYPEGLESKVKENLVKVEEVMGRKFGNKNSSLLLSVRSGSRASMPGMMDTVLNLGLNDRTIQGIIAESGNERFVYDSYRRFVQMYGNVVLGLKPEREDEVDPFEELLEAKKKAKGVSFDTELTVGDLRKLVIEFKSLIKERLGVSFPEDPWEQLWGAIGAVFKSWNTKRAVTYRRLHNIPHHWGTAVNVQSMVFGNMGEDSATGVAFTRDPSTGEKVFFGEFLVNAQGEDVVAGIRTPQPINRAQKRGNDLLSLEEVMPELYEELVGIYQKLERHYRDMQDLEFTIERGCLWLLQTRTGKRTINAAMKIAVDMVDEGLISEEEALLRLDPEQLNQLLHPNIDPKAKKNVIAKGLPASPGAAVGKVVFSANEAERKATEEGKSVILVRIETSPEDIHGMHAAKGILTARGGMTCVGGDTLILTDRGFLAAKEAFSLIEGGTDLSILSYNHLSSSPVWKEIIAAGSRHSKAIRIAVSQTGRGLNNDLWITPDHKMFTIMDRKLIKKRLHDVIKDGDFVCILDRMPPLKKVECQPQLAYLAGAIFTDGSLHLAPTKGRVTFCQKAEPQKEEFIEAVNQTFSEVFGFGFGYSRIRNTTSQLRGRQISGTVKDLISNRRAPAQSLQDLKDDIVPWVLSLDACSIKNFLAGVVDGDGSFYNNRIQIYIGNETLLKGVVVSCLRLGIMPQVTSNRSIFNVQIVEGIKDILKFTHRVKGETKDRLYSSKLFGVRHLLTDIADDVNFMGRVKEGIKRNLLFGVDKLKRDILPLCQGEEKAELTSILESPLRMYRVLNTGDSEEIEVFNFEVNAADDLNKNFIAFTSRCTPLLISNSHAAVVARGMGKCCVAGCGAIKIDYTQRLFKVDSLVVKEGDIITLDGTKGEVILGEVPTTTPELSGYLSRVMDWTERYKRLKVRTNADTPHDAKVARDFGAEGIGLCRTEHMFFEEDRIKAVREMILSSEEKDRRKALTKILPMQRGDFKEIFREMEGLPVTIRLLDPPLHEFLPHSDSEIKELARDMGVPFDVLKAKRDSLREFNPMLGHRGCRVGITYPEIYEMQARAIMEAACELTSEGVVVIPEIMIPLVGEVKELKILRELVVRVCKKVIKDCGTEVDYSIGTMIELPRAALTAQEIAEEAEFFSFGTNDLTQTVYGISRDDANTFLPYYIEHGVFEKDPFVSLDQVGVGELIKIALEKGRITRPDIKLGICGEHGGEPSSVEFCHKVGLDYVSCSPYRVPIARLAAARIALQDKK